MFGGIFCAGLALFLTQGKAWKYLLWHGATGGIFPDLFESIGAAISDDPYALKSMKDKKLSYSNILGQWLR